MKYLYRFEEMVESRDKIISDTEDVIKEQKELIDYLRKNKKNRFEELAKSLENQIEQEIVQMNSLKEKNEKTKTLISNLKNAPAISVALVEEVLDELEIFKKKEQVQE